MRHDLEQSLQALASEKLALKLFEIIVVKNKAGYELFNNYQISRVNNLWNLQCLYAPINHDFYMLRSAAAYSVFHNSNYISDAEQVRLLDLKLGGQLNNLAILNGLMQRCQDAERSGIYSAKIQEHIHNSNIMTPQLQALCIKSRDLQLRKFQDKKINKI